MRTVSRAVVAACGVAACGLAAAQSGPKPEVRPAALTQPAPPLIPPADHQAADPAKADALPTMLAEAKAAHARLRDYACTYTRQERAGGALGAEQVAELKVRLAPHCVHVRFARPEAAAGMEAAFMANKRDGKVRFRPAGVAGVSGFVTLRADDPKYLATAHHPLPQTGIGPVIEWVAAATAREKAAGNPVEVYTSDFQFAGRPVTRYEVYTRRPHAYRAWYKCVVFVDKETKLPVRYEAYDQPKAGSVGELREAYSFSDLKLNVGLGDNSFDF